MVNTPEDNITIAMTHDQQDAIIVQVCKGIYNDMKDQIAQLESTPDLKEYQLADLSDNRELKSACELLVRYHLNEYDYKKEMLI
jgi:hypothetical protein